MAKLFKIKFCSTDENIEFDDKITKSKREVEINIFKQLIHFSLSETKNMSSMGLLYDILDMIRNINDKEYISLTKEDLELLQKGFEQTAGRRPVGWMIYGENVLRQLIKPEEMEV